MGTGTLSTKTYSDKQEKCIANALGWTQVSGSGARPTRPGDVISTEFLGECKTHVSKVTKLEFKYDVWLKIKDEAASQFKHPILFVDDGTQKLSKTWCMFDVLPGRDYTILDYPKKVTKNISFEPELIFNPNYDTPILFQVSKFNSYISTFYDFQELFGD